MTAGSRAERGPDGALRLAPVLVPKPWGGRALARLGRDLPDDLGRVGESWEVADLVPDATPVADPCSRVVDGPHAGRSLAELVAQDRTWLLGDAAATPAGRFPLLVKLLDASEDLSVQVHPTPATASPGEHVKTETWVVLDAEPGARVLLGLRPGTTRAAFAAAAGTADVVQLLRPVPVAAGDVLHLPSGLVHALGAGVVVVEVQTPSDTTHRLHDWAELGRAPRELHVEQATEAVLDAWDANLAEPQRPAGVGVLVSEDAYLLARNRLAAGETWRARDSRPWVVVVLDGTPTVCGERLARADVRLVPAAVDCELAGPGTVLLASPTA